MISKLFENKLRQNFFRLALLSVITVIAWIGFNIYRSINKSQIKLEKEKYLSPLTSDLDLDTMETIKKRIKTKPEAWGILELELSETLLSPRETSPSVESEEATSSGDL